MPPRFSYVYTLPDITQKLKAYVDSLSIVGMAVKRTGFGVYVALKRTGCVSISH